VRLVILESPYQGATPAQRRRNRKYAARAMLDSLARGESPFASHLLWPGILDDADPLERHKGIEASLEWLRVASATVVYKDLGITDGMKIGISRAQMLNKPIEYRSIAAIHALTAAR